MNDLHGIIFSYEKHNQLKDLTRDRMPASVPFAGRYRIIDFILSSMVNAGITDVGVVLQGNYLSLLDHLQSGRDWDLNRTRGGLKLLPPFSRLRSGLTQEFRGRVEALAGVRTYLERIRQSHVVLANGDLVLSLPIEKVFQDHLSSGADITAVCTANPAAPENATYFRLDGDGHVRDTLFSLSDPTGLYRSLEVYILSKELLLRLVDDCASHDQYSFRRSVLQAGADALDIRSYVWDGYAAQIFTLKEYYDRSMELLNPAIRREVFNPQFPIHTKERSDASTYIDPDGTCRNSIVADGCTIEGSVEDSILFRNVSIARGAQVKNCILLPGATVGRDSIIHYVVADKYVEVLPSRTLMGHEHYPISIEKGSRV